MTLTVLAISCTKTTPAGFWTDFHKEFLTTNNSNQGPWGGQRELSWKGEINYAFTENELIDYASKNDWSLIDSITLRTDSLNVETLTKLKNDDYSLAILKETVVPNIKPNNSKLFIFKTTWLSVEPGNARETFENGFAVLNSEGRELKIYHFWGE